ncbi:MAG: esterase-like activity of phytase family protein [Phycisphaerales bacterium JB063]
MRFRPTRQLTFAAAVAFSPLPAIADVEINATGQSQTGVSHDNIHELSGITFLGGDQFLLVSDKDGQLVRATIAIDTATGLFASAPTLDSATTLSFIGGADLEGIAYDPRDASILVSNEADHTITRHNPDTAALLGSVAVPAVYLQAANNRSLESLSLDPRGDTLWTANEEALTVDGPFATDTEGTLVRLQQFDVDGEPIAQFAYRTEPHRTSGDSRARNGVADLIALPDGRVIVMERDLGGGILTFQNHFYLVDPTDATNTSDLDGLIGETITTAQKTHLFTLNAGFSNFEGVTLGPRLDNGDYAIILVSDDGGGSGFNGQNLITLRLSGIALPGDLDGDWLVGAADLDIILAHWGQAVDAGVLLQGDADANGTVDQQDLDIVLNHWGQGDPPQVDIPEPAGLLGLGAGLMFCSKRVR